MGRTILARLGTGQMDPQLAAVFGQPWGILEEAALALGLGQTMSALDLGVDAVFLVCREPLHAGGRFYDVGRLWARERASERRRPLIAPPRLRAWIDQLLDHPDLTLLQECRDHLTHRTPRRGFTFHLDQRGRPTVRELAEITTLHGLQPARPRGSIAELVPHLVGFGEQQLEALCTATLATTWTR